MALPRTLRFRPPLAFTALLLLAAGVPPQQPRRRVVLISFDAVAGERLQRRRLLTI